MNRFPSFAKCVVAVLLAVGVTAGAALPAEAAARNGASTARLADTGWD